VCDKLAVLKRLRNVCVGGDLREGAAVGGFVDEVAVANKVI